MFQSNPLLGCVAAGVVASMNLLYVQPPVLHGRDNGLAWHSGADHQHQVPRGPDDGSLATTFTVSGTTSVAVGHYTVFPNTVTSEESYACDWTEADRMQATVISDYPGLPVEIACWPTGPLGPPRIVTAS